MYIDPRRLDEVSAGSVPLFTDRELKVGYGNKEEETAERWGVRNLGQKRRTLKDNI